MTFLKTMFFHCFLREILLFVLFFSLGNTYSVVDFTIANEFAEKEGLKQSESADQDKEIKLKEGEEEERPLWTKYRSRSQIYSDYQEKIKDLAQKCDEKGMTLEAQVTRSVLIDTKDFYFIVPIFSKELSPTNLPSDASIEQRLWYKQLIELQQQYANETYALALRQGKKKLGYDVVESILQTLSIYPDHEKARAFWGYSLHNGQWLTDWEIKQLDKGYVDTPDFGWLQCDHVGEYEKGKRFYHNRWISKKEEEEKILASSSGWHIETEHFSILSRISLERGVELGRFLETFYQSWSQLFYPFIADENKWCSKLRSNAPLVTKRHKVIIYRDRKEYLRELRKYDTRATVSIGGYFPDLKCIFVYEPDSRDSEDSFDLYSLLAHEATHQLFNECNVSSISRNKSTFSNLAKNGNFWVIEGVAVYTETYLMNEKNKTAEFGGYKGNFRIKCAMESLFEENTYIPLRKYSALSKKGFKNYKDVDLLYSQAAGLSFFFIHYDEGKYRNAFVRYLFSIYQGEDSPFILEQLIGKKYEEIDQEYQVFMQTLYEKTLVENFEEK